ncbi:hypothetical protein D6783_01205 [Candidatus Woesearchaeota archaeon]|nr:MAG: hypothetical protein D6783_01205 [Candidatus Woesearchaeota archaeon]
MFVTITGKPGAGKTTLGKRLAALLGCPFHSAGDLLGRMAQERGMRIEELDAVHGEHVELDHAFEQYQAEVARKEGSGVFDGWVAFVAIPSSVKVFLDVSWEVAARRIFLHPRPDEERVRSVEEQEALLRERFEKNRRRFLKAYGVDLLDVTQYDIVFKTDGVSPEEGARELLSRIKKLKQK